MLPTMSSALVLSIVFIAISFTAGRSSYISDYSDEYLETQLMPGESPPPRDDIRIVIEDKVPHSNWGYWGPWAYCDPADHAVVARLKTETNVGRDRDDSSVNGIELACGRKERHYFIRSSMGKWGELGAIGGCGYSSRIVGFAISVETYQGSCTNKGYRGCDDTATNGLRIICGHWTYGGILQYKRTQDLNGTFWGSWQEDQLCPPFTYVCGIQTQVDDNGSTQANATKGDMDITGLNGVKMACCNGPMWEVTTTVWPDGGS